MFTSSMYNKTSTFKPEFKPNSAPKAEFSAAMHGGVVFYRGIDELWIGDGTGTYEGNPDNGILYAKTVDGSVATLGPVSDYYYAVSQGYEGTFEQWVAFLLSTSNYATESHMWANGGEQGTPSETNNAKYYMEQAAAYADAASRSSAAVERITEAQIDALF